MIIVPAIKVPRADVASSSDRDPRALIHDWEWLGFRRIHLIDTPGGPTGGRRRQAEDLLHDIHIEAEVQGDIDSADAVDALVEAGASRVVLGSRALDEPDWLRSTAAAFPEVIVVETAARERRVRSRGWSRTLSVDLSDLADELADIPLAALHVRFAADGTLGLSEFALIE